MTECEKIKSRYSETGIGEDKRPMFLYGLNYLAWSLFWEATQFSSVTREGIPTIDNLEFALSLSDLRLTSEQYRTMISKIGLIYVQMRSYWIAQLAKNRSPIDG